MKISRKLAAAATTATAVSGLFLGGVVMAVPASADTCNSTSFELFTSTTGYCFDSAMDVSGTFYNVHSFCSGSHGASGYYSDALNPTPRSFYIPANSGCGHFPDYPAVTLTTISSLEIH